jgi:hypothetical protein
MNAVGDALLKGKRPGPVYYGLSQYTNAISEGNHFILF